MYKLMTVDVWDTLLRRDCHPEFIKLATAAHLFYAPECHVSREFRTHWDIYSIRVHIESSHADKSEAAGFDREYNITDVFKEWLDRVCPSPYPDDLPETLADYELATELARSYPDPEIINYLSRIPAHRKIFLSDFYMESQALSKLLKDKGLDTFIPEGLSSCDFKLNKRSGALFRHVHKLYQITPDEHIHIGDNDWSDVESPAQIGIQSILYKPAAQHAQREKIESLFLSRASLFTEVQNQVDQIDSPSFCDAPSAVAAFRLGLKAAPLFVGFVRYVAERSVMDRLDKICYMTREGEFLKKIHDALFSPGGDIYGHRVPPAVLIEVSRLSTFAPSLNNVSVHDLARIWRVHGKQPVSGFFLSLGLAPSRFYHLLNQLHISKDEVIHSPEHDPRFIQLIRSREFIDALEARIEEQKHLLTSYLSSKGVADGMRIGVIDVGWRGSIQDNLSRVLPHAASFGYYIGLKKFVEPQPKQALKHAYLINESLGLSSMEAQCFESCTAIEMLCCPNSGSVQNYGRVADEAIAIRSSNMDEVAVHDRFTQFFQSGVLSATQAWSEHLSRHVISSADLRDLALHIWAGIGRNPQEELVKAFMSSPQHDIFGFGDVFYKSDIPSLRTICLSPFHPPSRRTVLSFIGRIQWTSAIKKLPGIGPVHKSSLISLFVLANFYRRLRVSWRK